MSSFARTRAFTFPFLAAAAFLVGTIWRFLADATPSSATIVAIGGAVLNQSPPPVVSETALQNNEFLNLFTERTAYTSPTAVPVDISTFPAHLTAESTTSRLASSRRAQQSIATSCSPIRLGSRTPSTRITQH